MNRRILALSSACFLSAVLQSFRAVVLPHSLREGIPDALNHAGTKARTFG
jgi:hypothetical protein